MLSEYNQAFLSDFFDQTFLWNELTILWNDLTIDWNDLTWNDLTMERNDRKSVWCHRGSFLRIFLR